MSWTPLRTWVNGEVPTSGYFNAQIGGNFGVLAISRDTTSGKIAAISSTYFASLVGTNLTGVALLAVSNSFTGGTHDFNAGTATRFVIPVGADKYDGAPGNKSTGSLWTEGDYLHFVDDTQNEWRYLGTLVGATAQAKGSLWVEGTAVHYISENGDERYTPGVTTSMHSDAAAKTGSTWIETYQHWIREAGTLEYNGLTPHSDGTSHDDVAHSDVAHGDTVHADHGDTVHADVPAPPIHVDHSDYVHQDIPHADHTDNVPHSDHTDHADVVAMPVLVGP